MAEPVSCVSCGYDGGIAHLQEKMEWQKKVFEAEKRAVADPMVRLGKTIVASVAVFLTASVLGMAHCSAVKQPDPAPIPPAPAIHAQEQLAGMYKACLDQAIRVQYEGKYSGDRTYVGPESGNIVRNCNEIFGPKIRDMVTGIEASQK